MDIHRCKGCAFYWAIIIETNNFGGKIVGHGTLLVIVVSENDILVKYTSDKKNKLMWVGI